MKNLFSAFTLLIIISCQQDAKKDFSQNQYVAVYKSDTAYLSINTADKKFFGTLKILKSGVALDSGFVEGDVIDTLLLGSYYYLPHKSKNKKRRAFALLQKHGNYIEGTGLQTIYMGIPSYNPQSISFDNPKFIFSKK